MTSSTQLATSRIAPRGGLEVAACLPENFGFREGRGSVHTSRTMMLAELASLLGATQANSTRAKYWEACINENVLSKRTPVTRRRTVERLTELYALDPGITVFRILRKLWDADAEARPLLACLCAQARDPLFRSTTDFVLAIKTGELITVDALSHAVEERNPGRFSTKTLRSVAQNIASSWLQSGFFSGHMRKARRRPVATPTTAAYALALAALAGAKGQFLFSSHWVKLLDSPNDVVLDLAREASRRGWIDFRAVGAVVEVKFPHLLTAKEQEALRGQD